MPTKKQTTKPVAKKVAKKPVAKASKKAIKGKGTKAPAKRASRAANHNAVRSLVSTSKRDRAYQASKGKAAPKKATRAKPSTPAVPFVLKTKFLQVTVGGKPFTLDSTHPTFDRMKKALLAGKWSDVPKLVTLAQSLFDASHGNVTVKNGTVYYKGTQIHDSLTARITDMIKSKKDVSFMLKFTDNLMQNESPEAREEFGTWLINNDLPITDDGCFIAYKSLNAHLKDQHTGTIDNSPGQRIRGSRKWFDKNYRTQCSSGYHICSKQYGLYGTRVAAVKVNPRDVLSASGGKMRVVGYEVLQELGRKDELTFQEEGFSALEKKVVVEVKAERKELLKMLLASAPVKRLIRAGKVAKTSIERAAYGRLKVMAQKYDLVPANFKEQPDNVVVPFLKAARIAAGLTVGQMSKEMVMPYKKTSDLEARPNPTEHEMDLYLEAIARLVGLRDHRAMAITEPKAMATV